MTSPGSAEMCRGFNLKSRTSAGILAGFYRDIVQGFNLKVRPAVPGF